ncbi:MAG: oxidase [Bacteroidetes Order II. Incertae sedis bacterium]|jgi:cytochrome c oxidase subunit IV|nr:oxidase [Bacteroidetes Order II. bacterium]HAY36302.1 oxidase [Bacteroidota bacterium]MBT4053432.1 oxidase [Bacteroidetes Order II. bacterium]MBT4602255.1 oxidase [Bacteroidetes Order II. bacterium]MBT5249458.1 oxidase [Bacteroidetes Order II. bacterium]
MSQGHHITSIKTLSIVIGALVILTGLTVFTSRFDLGVFTVPLALAIATTKAALVVTIFMALRWDNKINAAIFGIGILFVIVFISFVLFDTAFRGDLPNTTKGTIMEMEASEAEMQSREPDASTRQFNRTPE